MAGKQYDITPILKGGSWKPKQIDDECPIGTIKLDREEFNNASLR